MKRRGYLRIMGCICVALLLTIPFSNINAERMYISRLGEIEIHLSQFDTGIYASSNCGPTALGMIFNYLGYPYKSVEWLRKEISNNAGWIYTNEVEAYLDKNYISYQISSIKSENDLIQLINNEYIVMLCMNVSYISYNSNPYMGRQYKGNTGHYVVVSGYYKDDKGCYFEVLDPSNDTVRYYLASELVQGVTNWWPWGFIFKQERLEAID